MEISVSKLSRPKFVNAITFERYQFFIEHPEKTETQSDGRIRKWANISEVGKYLRVILLDDGETVHNTFFDRSYKED